MAEPHGKAFKAFIGTSGFQYDHWKPDFYPSGTPKTRWFEFYAERFSTVEINGTFYSLPRAATFRKWREQAPDGFRFALKFSRYGSHIKRLKDPEATIGRFLDVAGELGPALGPILVQLPPNWRPDPERLRGFLEAAPAEHRWAIEFRDPEWFRDDVFDLLREYNAALCIHDMLPDHPAVSTADWIYLRFHGEDYAGRYTPQYLTARAAECGDWIADGKDVHAYFNNDAGAAAPADALNLARYIERRT